MKQTLISRKIELLSDLYYSVRFRKGSFLSNIMTLLGGNIIAQLLTIAAAPILSRLYMREDFGVFGLYLSISAIIGGVASWQYSQAIMLPSEDEESITVVALSELIVVGMSLLILIIVVVWKDRIAEILNAPLFAKWIWLIPAYVMLTGFDDILSCWFSRKKKFKYIAGTRIVNAFTHNCAKISFALFTFLKAGGLIIGQILGALMMILILKCIFWRDNKALIQSSIKFSKIKETMRRYSKFPKYQSWAILVNRLSTQLPILILGYFFTPVIVGLYFFSFRILGMPISMISGAIGNVFFQRVAEENNLKGHYRDILIKTSLGLFVIGIFPFLIIGILGPQIFSFVFGAKWYEAGEYVRILTPFFLVMFVVSPLTTALVIAEKQELILMIQLLYLVLCSVMLIAGGLMKDVKLAILLYSIGGSIRYLIELYFCFKFANIKYNKRTC